MDESGRISWIFNYLIFNFVFQRGLNLVLLIYNH